MTEFHEGLEKNDPVWVKRVLGDPVLSMKKMAVLIRLPNELFREYGIQSMDDVQPEFVVQKEEDLK